MPPTERRYTYSIVICAFTLERWNDLSHAVGSVLNQSQSDDEIIVVIDHNDDMFEHSLRFWADEPRVTVAKNSHTRGLSGARNTGVAVATKDVVAFLDDDAAAEEGFLDAFDEAFSADTVLGVGGVPLPVWPEGGKPNWFIPELLWVVGCHYGPIPKQAVPIRNPIGAAMAFRAPVFAQVGTFSEDVGRLGSLPLGCEETELSIRIRQHFPDAVIMLSPAAVVRHRVTPHRTTVKYVARRCYAEGVSKAIVSRLRGASDSLSSERSYLASALPQAIARELKLIPRGQGAGLKGIGVVMLTVACAGFGFVRGSLSRKRVA